MSEILSHFGRAVRLDVMDTHEDPNKTDPSADDCSTGNACVSADSPPDRTASLAARQRRLTRALGDLGLLRLVGTNWINISDDGVTFGSLNDKAGERLLVALEDLAELLDHVPVVAPVPITGQLILPFTPMAVPARFLELAR